MKAILKYPGSKWSIAEWIIGFFPPHSSYLEPFFGSGEVLFRKPRSPIETVNDLDGEVVNLFRWIREDPEKLAHEIYYIPYARQVYEESYGEPPGDSLQQAVRFAIRLQMGYGYRTNGERVGWKRDIQGREAAYAARDWRSLPERLLEAAERLRGVQIENRPAVELIREYHSEKVLLYLDPPYMPQTRYRKQYRHEMFTEESHEELLAAALQHKGPVLISGYDSDLYRRMLRGWRREETIGHNQRGGKRKEVLWMNFESCRQISLQEIAVQGQEGGL
ncbi:MAG: DNA adenine methylase [Roseburia sp.]|nr:DNA adenine methylase [Roseburia sp.]MCM1097804.1 DNA adenine methylase [Ruminococcus flavefaciens]